MASDKEIIIVDGTVLNFSYSTQRFGGRFRFSVKETLTVQTQKINCGKGAPTLGEIGAQVKALDELVATKDYIALTVNGHPFKDSRFQLASFKLEEGDWLYVTGGTLVFEAFREGSLKDMIKTVNSSGDDFAGWNDDVDWTFIEDFSDTFNFSRANNSISYDHSASIKYAALNPTDDADGGVLTPPLVAGLALAKALLQDGRPKFDWIIGANTTQAINPSDVESHGLQELYSDIDPGYFRTFTESVDEINSTVSVSEKFDAENAIVGDSSTDYSFSAQQTFEMTAEGIINVSEKGTVMSLKDNNGRVDPEEFLKAEIENAIKDDGRLVALFNAHTEDVKGCEDDSGESTVPGLITDDDNDLVLIQKGITRDLFRGKASYSIKATNDPKIGAGSSHVYTRTIGGGEYGTISEDGTFTGEKSDNSDPDSGGELRQERFEQAEDAFEAYTDTVRTELTTEIAADVELQPVRISTGYNPFKGTVSYSIEYSLDPAYQLRTTDCKYITKSTSRTEATTGDTNDECLKQYTLQDVIGYSQVLQKRSTTQLPAASTTIKAVGHRNASLEDIIGAVDSEIGNPIGPPATGPKAVKSLSYNYGPENDKILDISIAWE